MQERPAWKLRLSFLQSAVGHLLGAVDTPITLDVDRPGKSRCMQHARVYVVDRRLIFLPYTVEMEAS
jgi:hypothetical protein